MGRLRAEVKLKKGTVLQKTIRGRFGSVEEAQEFLFSNGGSCAKDCLDFWQDQEGEKESLEIIVYHYEEKVGRSWDKKATWWQDLETGTITKVYEKYV